MAKVVVLYLSTQGNTRIMAEAIANGLRSKNVDVEVKSFYEASLDDVKKADGIAVGSSTFFYRVLEPLDKFLDKMQSIDVKGKVGAAFGSYGWSGEAPRMIAEKMRAMGIEVIDPVLRVQYKPTEKDIAECERLGKDLAEKVKHR